jgi:hypothetical protein
MREVEVGGSTFESARPRTPKYTRNAMDMDKMELKGEEEDDGRGPLFLEDPPAPPEMENVSRSY